jgi:hypothetical protein
MKTKKKWWLSLLTPFIIVGQLLAILSLVLAYYVSLLVVSPISWLVRKIVKLFRKSK